MAKPKVKLKSSKTARPVAPKLAGQNTKLAPHIKSKQELNDLRDMLTDGKITREQYEASYPDLAQNLFDNQEKNGFEMDLDGIRENYYSQPPIDPTQDNLLGPLPNTNAAANPPEMNDLSTQRLAVMVAADKAKAEAAAAAAQGPPKFQSARELEMTEEDNPRIAPVVSAEAGIAAAKQLEAEKYARANPELWRPKAEHTGRMTPEEIQIIRDEREYYNTTPAQKYYDTGGQKPAAPQAPQPPVARAVPPMAQTMRQAAPTTQPATAAPTPQPAQPQPTLPNTNSAYWNVRIPKPSFGKLIKGGAQMLGGAGLAGGSLVGANALYKLLGTSQPPERTIEEKIDSNPIFNFDPKAPPRQR